MRIAAIGAGNVGRALGSAWTRAGHEVRYGVRKPDAARADESGVGEAAGFGQVVVLATPWAAVPDALSACGDLSGKVLVDCTNPLLADLSGLELGTTTSGGEVVAALAPGARVVKAFNTIGANIMAHPVFDGENLTLLFCGDDAEAKAVVRELAADCGFVPVDAGGLRQARLLEPMALLWISLAMRGHGREIGFQLLKRQTGEQIGFGTAR